MSSIVQNMLQKSIGDGARATKFQILFEFTNPSSGPSANDMVTMAKTTSFPGKSHSIIDFKYKGRSIPLRGQTKYTQTWECTFYLTEDHKLKNAFENWMEALDEKHNYMDVSTIAGVSDTQRLHNTKRNYTTTIVLYQRNFDDDQDTAVYHLHNVFPIEVSPIQYGYDNQGQIQEFTVTFAYSYFTMNVMKGRAGNFIDSLVDKWKSGVTSMVQGAMNKVADGINGFIKDATGDTLNKLNDWASGLTKDLVPSGGNTAKDLVSGGLPPQFMGPGVLDSIASSAGKSLSAITNAASGLAGDAVNAAKGMATSAFNDAQSKITSKVKSLI